jgi:ribosomal protein S18 acetylase RimI-like enzyme
MPFEVRELAEADIDAAASVVFAAFRRIADANNAFSFTASSEEQSRRVVAGAWGNPSGITLVASDKTHDDLLGVIAVQRMGSVAWDIGPVAVSVHHQARGLGRALIRAAITRVDSTHEKSGAEGQPLIFLTVDTFNMGALALYSGCGFSVQAPLLVMELAVASSNRVAVADPCVRSAKPIDLPDCAAISQTTACVDLSEEVCKHIERTRVYRSMDGELLGYCTCFDMSGHLVASTMDAAKALLQSAGRDGESDRTPPRICVPVQTYPQLMQWMLSNGWRCVKTLLLMSKGPYRSPTSAVEGNVYFPQC